MGAMAWSADCQWSVVVGAQKSHGRYSREQPQGPLCTFRRECPSARATLPPLPVLRGRIEEGVVPIGAPVPYREPPPLPSPGVPGEGIGADFRLCRVAPHFPLATRVLFPRRTPVVIPRSALRPERVVMSEDYQQAAVRTLSWVGLRYWRSFRTQRGLRASVPPWWNLNWFAGEPVIRRPPPRRGASLMPVSRDRARGLGRVGRRGLGCRIPGRRPT
jgi:hypothetical protein